MRVLMDRADVLAEKELGWRVWDSGLKSQRFQFMTGIGASYVIFLTLAPLCLEDGYSCLVVIGTIGQEVTWGHSHAQAP